MSKLQASDVSNVQSVLITVIFTLKLVMVSQINTKITSLLNLIPLFSVFDPEKQY